jgi:hypothetical protein
VFLAHEVPTIAYPEPDRANTVTPVILALLAELCPQYWPAQCGIPETVAVMSKSVTDQIAQADKSPKLPLHRDSEIAVREEFELARSKGTIEAMETFVARHSDHPLAAEAKRTIRRLRQTTR